MAKIKFAKQSRVFQGDILRDVEYIEYVTERNGVVEIAKVIFPFVVVLTQDCDLEQDYKFRYSRAVTNNEDKWLISVLVAPLYNAEHVYGGEHLSELQMKMGQISRSRSSGNNLKTNQTARYHYLDFGDAVPLPDLVIDFKHYFSISLPVIKKWKKNNFICQLGPLFREDLSQRFASYLSRVGLP